MSVSQTSSIPPAQPGTKTGVAALLAGLRRHWLMTGLVLLTLAGILYWQLNANRAPADQPLIVAVTQGDIENTVTAAGSIQPSRYVDVGAQVSGQLEKLLVDVGEAVSAGQLLAEIDPSVQASRVAASKASLEALEAQLSSRAAALKLAQANAERQERLMHDDATTQADYDRAVNDLASAQSSLSQLQAQITQSKASLASDEATLGYSKIYAPIAGTVVSIAFKEGQTLNASQQAPTILRIADLGVMTIETNVSEADVGKLRGSMEVYFTTLGGGVRRWQGQLRQILPTPQIVNNVVLYTALFDVNNQDGALLSGMTAQVYFVTAAARDVITVPMGALSFNNTGEQSQRPQSAAGRPPGPGPGAAGMGGPPAMAGQWSRGAGATGPDAPGGARARSAMVRLVKADGSIEEREVRIGLTSRIAAEVIAGLQPGDQVVAGIVQSQLPPPAENNARRGGMRW